MRQTPDKSWCFLISAFAKIRKLALWIHTSYLTSLRLGFLVNRIGPVIIPILQVVLWIRDYVCKVSSIRGLSAWGSDYYVCEFIKCFLFSESPYEERFALYEPRTRYMEDKQLKPCTCLFQRRKPLKESTFIFCHQLLGN